MMAQQDEEHVSDAHMRRFLVREATPEERRVVMAHLLACETCRDLSASLVEEGVGGWRPRAPTSDAAYDAAFDRALGRSGALLGWLAEEKLEGWAHWSMLEPLSPTDRETRVLADRRLHTWGLHQRLLEASRIASRNDPAEGIEIVKLAILVAEHIDARAIGGEEGRHDLLAETYARLGNAHRLASDLEMARMALDRAWQEAFLGHRDPMTHASIIRLEASWMTACGEFETAEVALEEALRLYHKASERTEEARTLVQMGNAIGYLIPERGIAHIRRALPLINVAREPRLELCAHHDLAFILTHAGQGQGALEILESVRPLYRQFPDRYTQVRLHWLEGRIARNLGKIEEARAIFRQIHEEFRVRDQRLELVLVSLDLAEALAAQKRYDDAIALVRNIHPLMAAWGLHSHALAAWLLLQNALKVRDTDHLFVDLHLYFRQHWQVGAEFVPRQER